MSELTIVGSSMSTLIAAVLTLGAAAPPVKSTPELPPFLPARPYEPPIPPWQRVNPRGHYRQRRPGRR